MSVHRTYACPIGRGQPPQVHGNSDSRAIAVISHSRWLDSRQWKTNRNRTQKIEKKKLFWITDLSIKSRFFSGIFQISNNRFQASCSFWSVQPTILAKAPPSFGEDKTSISETRSTTRQDLANSNLLYHQPDTRFKSSVCEEHSNRPPLAGSTTKSPRYLHQR